MSAEVEHPDICYVVPGMHRNDTLSGQPPKTRHYRHCAGGHFTWPDRSEPLGEPDLATEEQMRTLPACTDCITMGEGSPGSSTREDRLGDVCPSCYQVMPLTGICDNCG